MRHGGRLHSPPTAAHSAGPASARRAQATDPHRRRLHATRRRGAHSTTITTLHASRHRLHLLPTARPRRRRGRRHSGSGRRRRPGVGRRRPGIHRRRLFRRGPGHGPRRRRAGRPVDARRCVRVGIHSHSVAAAGWPHRGAVAAAPARSGCRAGRVYVRADDAVVGRRTHSRRGRRRGSRARPHACLQRARRRHHPARRRRRAGGWRRGRAGSGPPASHTGERRRGAAGCRCSAAGDRAGPRILGSRPQKAVRSHFRHPTSSRALDAGVARGGGGRPASTSPARRRRGRRCRLALPAAGVELHRLLFPTPGSRRGRCAVCVGRVRQPKNVARRRHGARVGGGGRQRGRRGRPDRGRALGPDRHRRRRGAARRARIALILLCSQKSLTLSLPALIGAYSAAGGPPGGPAAAALSALPLVGAHLAQTTVDSFVAARWGAQTEAQGL